MTGGGNKGAGCSRESAPLSGPLAAAVGGGDAGAGGAGGGTGGTGGAGGGAGAAGAGPRPRGSGARAAPVPCAAPPPSPAASPCLQHPHRGHPPHRAPAAAVSGGTAAGRCGAPSGDPRAPSLLCAQSVLARGSPDLYGRPRGAGEIRAGACGGTICPACRAILGAVFAAEVQLKKRAVRFPSEGMLCRPFARLGH